MKPFDVRAGIPSTPPNPETVHDWERARDNAGQRSTLERIFSLQVTGQITWIRRPPRRLVWRPRLAMPEQTARIYLIAGKEEDPLPQTVTEEFLSPLSASENQETGLTFGEIELGRPVDRFTVHMCTTSEVRLQQRGARGANLRPSRHDEDTARLERRSDEALGGRVSVARIAPSLLDLRRGVPTGFHPTLNNDSNRLHEDCTRSVEVSYLQNIMVGEWSGEIWVALNIEVLKADVGEASIAGMQRRGKREIPEKTHRPAVSSGAIPTNEKPGSGLAWNRSYFAEVGGKAAVAERLARSPPTKANRAQSPAWSPGPSHVGIVPDDAVDRQVFSRISRFSHPFTPPPLHTHLNHPHRLPIPRFKSRPNLLTHSFSCYVQLIYKPTLSQSISHQFYIHVMCWSATSALVLTSPSLVGYLALRSTRTLSSVVASHALVRRSLLQHLPPPPALFFQVPSLTSPKGRGSDVSQWQPSIIPRRPSDVAVAVSRYISGQVLRVLYKREPLIPSSLKAAFMSSHVERPKDITKIQSISAELIGYSKEPFIADCMQAEVAGLAEFVVRACAVNFIVALTTSPAEKFAVSITSTRGSTLFETRRCRNWTMLVGMCRGKTAEFSCSRRATRTAAWINCLVNIAEDIAVNRRACYSHEDFANSFGGEIDSKHVLISATVVIARQLFRRAPFDCYPIISRKQSSVIFTVETKRQHLVSTYKAGSVWMIRAKVVAKRSNRHTYRFRSMWVGKRQNRVQLRRKREHPEKTYRLSARFPTAMLVSETLHAYNDGAEVFEEGGKQGFPLCVLLGKLFKEITVWCLKPSPAVYKTLSVSPDQRINKAIRPIPMLILHKAEDYPTCMQGDIKQDFQKCTFYIEQPIKADSGKHYNQRNRMELTV
ncbi:hypothetical protein PR048_009564 [Dryococelus australis]|uniref:Uncharacterized protein n=1 Tax=Dryococelus australis TaxID=614101 RepID=A0ABQ9I0B8_9NEOP|nr:hypothetical protein PR048_009564 [Dryococelus australis]